MSPGVWSAGALERGGGADFIISYIKFCGRNQFKKKSFRNIPFKTTPLPLNKFRPIPAVYPWSV